MKYIFEKCQQIRLNNRLVNVYNVYQTKIDGVTEEITEESHTRQECERPGVTVVTREEIITRRAAAQKITKVNARNNVKVLIGKAYGKTKKEAENNYFMQEIN